MGTGTRAFNLYAFMLFSLIASPFILFLITKILELLTPLIIYWYISLPVWILFLVAANWILHIYMKKKALKAEKEKFDKDLRIANIKRNTVVIKERRRQDRLNKHNSSK
ncbi:hypothetical protein QFZ77_000008 [Paenibacillus sp. V4I3]|nr:hypothetical protein [Paenibacillus sp. V4I3]